MAQKGSDWVAFELEGARPKPVEVADVRSTYRNILPGVDAAYLSGETGVSELLVLNSPNAPSTYTFKVRTSPGVTASTAADGTIEFRNASGEKRFSFAKPFMFDSGGGADGISEAVTTRLTRRSGAYRLELAADETWLRSERRLGPIILDPTITLDPSKSPCQSPLNTSPTDPNYAALTLAYFNPECRATREAEQSATPTCRLIGFFLIYPYLACSEDYIKNVYLPTLITYLTSPLVVGPTPSALPPAPPPPGRYRVSTCSHTPDKVNRSFVPVTGSSHHVIDECARNRLALVHHTNGENSPGHTSSLWALNAPAGTTLRSADYHVGGERTDNRGIGLYLNTDKGVVEGCTAYSAPPCTFSYRYSAAKTGVALGGASFLRLTTHCGFDGGCGAADVTHRLHGATVELDDLQAPTVTPKGGTLVTNNRQSGTSDVVFDAADNVGIKSARLLLDGVERAKADYPCDYTKTVPCANQTGRRLSYDAGLLRDGRHQVRLIATDASGREATWEKTINVDDTKPTLAAAGTLKDPAGRWVRGGDLRVEAKDDAALEDISGVKAIDVYVDGQRAGGSSQPACASGSCPLTYDFTLPATGYADGARAVRVTATDFAGNVAEDRFTVRLDRSAPGNALSGELTSHAGKWIPRAKDPAALRVAGTDGSATQPNSGVATVEVLVDGQRKSIKPEDVTCQGDSCALTEDFAFRQAEYAEGPRRVSAVVTDKAGNTASRELEVKVDRSPPALNLSGPLSDADGKVVSRGSYALQADARDGDAANPGSGVKSIEILVDGARKDYASQPCDAGNCPLGRSWAFNTADYSEGAHTIAVRAEDQVGRVEEKTLRVTVEGIDRAKPTLAAAGTLKDPAGRWIRGGELHVEARDDASPLEDASGVKAIDVYVDGVRAGGSSQPACASGSCPLTYDFTLPATGFADGARAVRVTATDFAGNVAEDRFTVRLDRTAPGAALSGELTTYAGKWLPRAEESLPLRIDGTDGTSTQAQSGVRSIETKVDGQAKAVKAQDPACTGDSCSLSETFDFRQASYGDGPHTVSALVTDEAGNATTREVAVKVDATQPGLALSGPLTEQDGKVVNGGTYALQADATDGDGAKPGSGSRSIVVLVDGEQKDSVTQACAAGNCKLSRSWTFDPAAYGEGRHEITVRAEDESGNRTERSLRVVVDRIGPEVKLSGNLWDDYQSGGRREKEALYDSSYQLEVVAEDSSLVGEARSGVSKIEIYVDGGVDPKSTAVQPCSVGNCPLAHRYSFATDAFLDGEHTIKVVASDYTGNSTSQAWNIFVDRKGDIYQAKALSDDPSTGGQLVDEEWGQLSTQHGRSVDTSSVGTRDAVPCTDNEGKASTCDEVRIRTLRGSGDSSDEDSYSVQRGSKEDDPNLPKVVGILDPKEDDPAATGSLDDVVASWQRKPPAYGARYERYDSTTTEEFVQGENEDGSQQLGDAEVSTELFVDEQTKLPIKLEAKRTSSNETLRRYYWTYERGRFERRELPSDFFGVARPADVGKESEVTLRGPAHLGLQVDPQSGATFTPYGLGARPAVRGEPHCLAASEVVTFRYHYPPDEGSPDPEAPTLDHLTAQRFSEFDYRNLSILGLDAVPECQVGDIEAGTPDLLVQTFASSSQAAEEWRASYRQNAEYVQANPADADFSRAGVVSPLLVGIDSTKAYVITLSEDRATALFDIGDATVIVTGRFDRNDLQKLVSQLAPR